ncbi:hypothetical protein V5F59_10075 [Xanthobacter autotrophicus DSM 431]|uniref:hypothetical protein n=1 Tax=Xanthobacter nonsaccharivorans TaxID=3119912 RepID=UPI003729B853
MEVFAIVFPFGKRRGTSESQINGLLDFPKLYVVGSIPIARSNLLSAHRDLRASTRVGS